VRARNFTAVEQSKGFDLTLMMRPVKALQLRLTLGHAKVASQPDLSSFRAYYEAAQKRRTRAQRCSWTRRTCLIPSITRPVPRAPAPRLGPAGWVVDYSFAKDSVPALRGVRMGVNGIWRDDYLFGVPNRQEMIGGSSHLVNVYVMRDQRIWGQQTRVRLGVRNLVDLETRTPVKPVSRLSRTARMFTAFRM